MKPATIEWVNPEGLHCSHTGPRYNFDIESNGLLEEMDRIHSIVFEDMDTGTIYSAHDHSDIWTNPGEKPGVLVTVSIETAVRMLMEAGELIGHNIIKFDIPAIQKIFPWFKPQGKITDTLVLSRLIFTNLADWDRAQSLKGKYPGRLIASHGLEAWGLRLGEWKGDYSKFMTETGLDPWAFWNPEMQLYCEQDIAVTRALLKTIEAKNYSPQSIELEHHFAHIIAQQERHGFKLDEDAAYNLYTVLIAKRQEIATKLKESFPPKVVRTVFVPKVNNKKQGYRKGVPFTKEKVVEFNPSSRQMIAERLKEFGWEPQSFTPNGQPKVDETILSKLPWPEAKVLAQHFLIEKRIGQLAEGDQAWLRLVRRGRIHGGVNTNGAVTGRCTHSRPNVAQVPSVGAPYGEDCRALFCVEKGRKLVGADLSGLELRCLAHFMASFDDGEYGRILLEGDIHWANVVSLGFVSDGTERDEEVYPIHKLFRNGAKTFIYGFLYGAGDQKAGEIVLDIAMREVRDGLGCSVFKKYFPDKKAKLGYKQNPTEEDLKKVGKKLKKTFLDKTPAIAKLRRLVKLRVEGFLPSTPPPHVLKKPAQYADKWKHFDGRWYFKATRGGTLLGLDGRKLHVRSAHSALNTLLQSAGALIAKQATIFAYQELSTRGYVFGKQYAFVAHVHDEMQVDTAEKYASEVGEILVQSMRKCTDHFNFRCPIDGEYKIGNNWKDTH